MAEDNKIETPEVETKSRRKFVTTAAQVAVTGPAVGLLLSASAKPAAAQISAYYVGCSRNICPSAYIFDDFTFGNTHEDIDASTFHSNFNPFNGKANQDDIFVPSSSGDDGVDDVTP